MPILSCCNSLSAQVHRRVNTYLCLLIYPAAKQMVKRSIGFSRGIISASHWNLTHLSTAASTQRLNLFTDAQTAFYESRGDQMRQWRCSWWRLTVCRFSPTLLKPSLTEMNVAAFVSHTIQCTERFLDIEHGSLLLTYSTQCSAPRGKSWSIPGRQISINAFLKVSPYLISFES